MVESAESVLDYSTVIDEERPYFDFNLINLPKLLTISEIMELNEEDSDSARTDLAKIMDLNCAIETSDAIITDYYFWIYWWGRCHLVNYNKIESLMTLSKFLLNNLRDLKLDQEENLKQLKKIILSTVVIQENKTPEVFTCDDLRQMLELFGTNFFQHYRLYECFFRRHRKEMTVYHTMIFETIESDMEQHPPPLKQAMSETTHKNQIDPNYPPVFIGSHPEIQHNVSLLMRTVHGN